MSEQKLEPHAPRASTGLTEGEMEALEWFQNWGASENPNEIMGARLASCVRRLSASTAGVGESAPIPESQWKAREWDSDTIMGAPEGLYHTGSKKDGKVYWWGHRELIHSTYIPERIKISLNSRPSVTLVFYGPVAVPPKQKDEK